MIFGIPFILGIATFFIFIFGGFSAIVGTHGGKEMPPEGAEILYLSTHPKFRPPPKPDASAPAHPQAASPARSEESSAPMGSVVTLRAAQSEPNQPPS